MNNKLLDILIDRAFNRILDTGDSADTTALVSLSAQPAHGAIGKICVIRTYSAGVHVGEVMAVSDSNVELKDSRRIYSWSGAFTLSAVSQNGIASTSKVACPVPTLYLMDAIEILPCSEIALENIMSQVVYVPS